MKEKWVDRVCDRCDKKEECITYQTSLTDVDRILFGCSRIEIEEKKYNKGENT